MKFLFQLNSPSSFVAYSLFSWPIASHTERVEELIKIGTSLLPDSLKP